MRIAKFLANPNGGCPVGSAVIAPLRRKFHRRDRIVDDHPAGPNDMAAIDCCIVGQDSHSQQSLVQPNAPVNAPKWVMPCNY